MHQNGALTFLNAELNVRRIEISECRDQCVEASLMPQNGPLRVLNTELNVLTQG